MSTQAEKSPPQKQMLNPLTGGGANFLRDVVSEAKRVVWPTIPETRAATATVILMVAILGLYLGGIDFVVSKLMELLPF